MKPMVRPFCILSLFLGCCALLASWPLCAHECEILLSSADLEADLDRVLGPWTVLAREREVTIDPAAQQCYLRIRIAVNVPLGDDCTLEACSVATFQDQRIGLREFDVQGCDALLSVLAISRHVPTSLADASEQIRSRCGAEPFDISAVEPALVAGQPRIRVSLRSRGTARRASP